MFARALIVLLLVLNLGVAAWWWLRPPAPAAAPPAQASGVPRLRLLSEVVPVRGVDRAPPVAIAPGISATPAPPAATAAAPAAAVAGAPACFTAGPFTDAATAATARTALRARGAQADERMETVAGGGPWNVAIAPQADRAAAQALGQRIAAAGFTDYYVVSGGTQANAIALGRFGNQAAATRHRDALVAAGFAAQVQPPPGAPPRHWLDVRATAAFDAAAARTALGAPLRPAACGALR